MRPSDSAFVIAHAAIAGLVAVLWALDDARGALAGIVGQNYLWVMVAAQLTGISVGVWQGMSGTGGRVRTLLCGTCPFALIIWWTLVAEGVINRALVMLPAGATSAVFLGPSLAGVMVGLMLRRDRGQGAPVFRRVFTERADRW